jgi:DNA-binding IclR family transcriptional regulator
MEHNSKGRVHSLKRGIEILKCFTPEKPVLRLVDLSKKLNISKSTLFRYVSTL